VCVCVSGLSECNLTMDLGSLGQRDMPELENTRGVRLFGCFSLELQAPSRGGFCIAKFGMNGPRIGPVGLCSKSGAGKEAPCPQELGKGSSGSAASAKISRRSSSCAHNCDLVLYLASLTRTRPKQAALCRFHYFGT